MGETVFLDVACRRSPPPSLLQAAQVPYETHVAYQQAEAAFRALYLGRPLDPNRSSAKIVQQHWSTVAQLAETLLCEKSLSREQVHELLLHASRGAAVGAEL